MSTEAGPLTTSIRSRNQGSITSELKEPPSLITLRPSRKVLLMLPSAKPRSTR